MSYKSNLNTWLCNFAPPPPPRKKKRKTKKGHQPLFQAKYCICIQISSVESQKGANNIQRCSLENQKGAIAVQSLWVIAPFWSSTEHIWIMKSALLALSWRYIGSIHDQWRPGSEHPPFWGLVIILPPPPPGGSLSTLLISTVIVRGSYLHCRWHPTTSGHIEILNP